MAARQHASRKIASVRTLWTLPKTRKAQKPTGWNAQPPEAWTFIPSQDTIPVDSKLGRKLGIQPADRVLVFAGGYGNWTAQLSRRAHVHYTDASKSMTDFAAHRNRGNIRSFKVRPAELQPRRSNQFDWSFSYEPFPLYFNISMQSALLRGLLNTKGIKIVVYGDVNIHIKGTHYFPHHVALMKQFATRYGAQFDLKTVVLKAVERSDHIEHNEKYLQPRSGDKTVFSIITIHTNDNSRKHATQDLRVQHQLEVDFKKNKTRRGSQIAQQLGITSAQFKQSLRRLRDVEEDLKR